MGDRDIIVFGTSARESKRQQPRRPSDEAEMFRIVNSNSDRRRWEREQEAQVNPTVELIRKIVLVAEWAVVGFFTALGIFAFISLFV